VSVPFDPANGGAGVIETYRDFLPVSEKTPVVSLKEGGTPLLYASRLSEDLEVEVFFKYEGLNPTGSFKDRGMTVAMSKALEEGALAVMCASTGNTSASAAAYAAAAGIRAIVLIPEGKIALGKLAQALVHGAKVIAVKGNFDQALAIVKELTARHHITLVNSLNPYRLEGQKTGAFEICDQMAPPDYLAIPVGNAGNITAYWMGFREYQQKGKITSLPRMIGFQAEGAAPIVRGHVVENPETIASAIRIGNPARWKEAEAAVTESDGFFDMVSDQEILSAYELIASREGIFAEPASAASVAGLIKSLRLGKVAKGSRVVCVLTGHGLKDPDIALHVSNKIIEAEASLEAVEKIIVP
jgi:threonine synthase